MNSHVLVTGGTGFTGGHLVRRLLRENFRVRAFVRDAERAAPLAEAGAELAVGDLRDAAAIRRALEGIDIVYHIAAQWQSEDVDAESWRDVNVQGTRNLLDASIEAKVRRFVHCSTVGVHGHIEEPPGTEVTPYGPGDYYQRSKLEGEQVVVDAMQSGKLPIAVFRPGPIYGPGDMRFAKLFKSVRRGWFIMIGPGDTFYHPTYIDDLVEGILLCGTKDEALGQVFILAGTEYVTLKQLVKQIADVTNGPRPRIRVPFWPVYVAAVLCEAVCRPFGIAPPLYRRRVDFFRKSRAFDTRKARLTLGFEPRVGLAEGLRRTAEWYREQGVIE